MKKITFLLTIISLVIFNGLITAQEACTSDGTKVYFTTNAGWSNSEWYQIINIDAENLGNSGIMKHDGIDGTKTSTVWNSGVFSTPVYTYNEGTSQYETTSVLWPVKYYLCCLNDTAHNSAWTKVNLLGTNPSGAGVNDAPCYFNNNSVKQSPIWNKKGFIELSRQAADAATPTVSRHGYIELIDLPMVERIQWSYSSTGWKRGVKLDIDYHDGNGYQPLRWEPSDIATSLAGFSEQGYAFEEIIGKQEDPNSKISLRWRIWDGDSIHGNLTKAEDVRTPYTTTMTPYAQKQVVRIHQIKVFAGAVPTQAPTLPDGIQLPLTNSIIAYVSARSILLSEQANFELYTYDGKKLLIGCSNKIDVSQMPKGIYILKASNEYGRTQKKIIL